MGSLLRNSTAYTELLFVNGVVQMAPVAGVMVNFTCLATLFFVFVRVIETSIYINELLAADTGVLLKTAVDVSLAKRQEGNDATRADPHLISLLANYTISEDQ